MANSFSVVGTIISISPIVVLPTHSGKEFKKRDLIVEIEDGDYPQQVKFQMVQNNVDKIDKYKPTDVVEVFFNLKGRAHTKDGTTAYFTNLDAWRVSSVNADNSAARAEQADKFDDVPF